MVKISYLNDGVIITLSGKIDASNVAEVERKAEHSGYIGKDVIIDAKNLEFISSAGLRVIMKLKKESRSLEVINASRDVSDIFEMTGFSQMISVKRILRKIDLASCEAMPLGNSFGMGKLFVMDDEHFLKAYPKGISQKQLEEQNRRGKLAQISGIPIAISYDIVDTGNGFGRIYSLRDSVTLNNELRKDPLGIAPYTKKFADLLKTVHSKQLECYLPYAKDMYMTYLLNMKKYLKESEKKVLANMIDAIPDVSTLLHGAYHLRNVIAVKKELSLVDMTDACLGFFLLDFATAWLSMYKISDANVEKVTGLNLRSRDFFWESFLGNYFDTTDSDKIRVIDEKIRTFALLKYCLSPGIVTDMSPKALAFFLDVIKKQVIPNQEKYTEDINNIYTTFRRLNIKWS